MANSLNQSFLAISPFHHIPALVDDNFNMVELVTINELLPATTPLLPLWLGLPGGDPEKIEAAKQKILTVLNLFESLLDNRPYFGSQNITLAEPVAGTVVPLLPAVGISLNDYPKLTAWTERLVRREAWQTTQPTPKAIQAFKSIIQARMAQQAS